MTAMHRTVGFVIVAILLAACSTTTSGAAASPTVPSSSAHAPPVATPVTTSESAARSGATTSPEPTASPGATATVTTTITAEPASTGRTTAAAPSAPTAPMLPPTDLAGEVYGFVTAVDLPNSQITLDKVDWFTGAAAKQACAEDGVTSTDNNQCTGYYYRNVNPALRVVAVSPQATITTLDGSRSVASDLAAVAGRISRTTGSTYHLIVTDGMVTDLQEMYHP